MIRRPRAPFAAPVPAAIAAAALLAAGCRGVQSALDPAAREAGQIAGLWWFFFWVCAAVFLAVITLLFVGVFRRGAVLLAIQESN